MRQAFHIFRKDVRQLWMELAITLALTAAFAFTGASQATWLSPTASRTIAWTLILFLLPASWGLLVARVIQAEALPGDRQFWLTRPYRRGSLLGAKVMFIVAFVNLPKLAADATILHAFGFAILPQTAGFLWSQLLLVAAVLLPIGALAAVTRNLVQALLTVMILGLALVAWSMLAPGGFLGWPWLALEWIRIDYAILILAVFSVAILFVQYARRATLHSRLIGSGALALAVLGIILLPWTAAFAIQARLPVAASEASKVTVRFAESRKWAAHALVEKSGQVQLVLPLQMDGVPAGVEAEADGLIASITAPDGTHWHTSGSPRFQVELIGQLLTLRGTLDGSIYQKLKDQRASLHGSLYLTLYGHEQIAVLPVENRPIPMPGVGVCSASHGPTSSSFLLLCTSAFRRPPGLVSIHFVGPHEDRADSLYSGMAVSYSPFPANGGISPVEQFFMYSAALSGLFTGVQVHLAPPIAHIRRDFEINGLRLREFEVPAQP